MEPDIEVRPISRLISEERHLGESEHDMERNFWGHHNTKPLNFATNPDDCDIQSVKKPKTPRDPMSHRIIEKRRRDRINNCLADLSRLIPSNYMKQGQGRIEKTEIIEMAIRYIKQLRVKLECHEVKQQQVEPSSPFLLSKQCCSEKFYMGFKECEAELMRFLVENEGWDAKDQICSRLMKQLDEASKKYKGRFSTAEGFGSDVKKDGDCHQMNMYESSECLSVEAYTSSALSSIYEGDMLDIAQYKNGNYGSYNLHNNKHLRTLLEKNAALSSTENESGIASLSNRDQDTQGTNLSGDGIDSDKKSSNSTDDTLEQDDCPAVCSSSRRGEDSSTYKFKQNITLRFSEEKRKASDSSSNSSRECPSKVKVRRKIKSKSLSPLSDSSMYPTSDYSSNGNGTSSAGENPSQSPMTQEHNIKEELMLKGASLPGFILHPMGSFYLPICLTESQVSVLGLVPFFDASTHHPSTLLHPISIPVNFGSNSLTMRNINIQANFSQNRAMHCDRDELGSQKT